MSTVEQYRNLLKFVYENGVPAKSQQGVDAITYIGPPPMRFRPADGFPMITERNMAPKMPVTIWRQAIGEICAFINGARTLEEIGAFGCHWWGPWATEAKCHKRGLEPGDLGPGSYGGAFHNFPTAEGESFNQFDVLLQQIAEKPWLRTHLVTPFIPHYIPRVEGRVQKVTIVPCHGMLFIRIIDGVLNLTMVQRSGDVPIGVPSNMVQYGALLLMLAQVTGYEPGEFIHFINDAHIYTDQITGVETMLRREPRPLPRLTIDPSVTDLFAFRHEHFEIAEYNPHPGIAKIPVAI